MPRIGAMAGDVDVARRRLDLAVAFDDLAVAVDQQQMLGPASPTSAGRRG